MEYTKALEACICPYYLDIHVYLQYSDFIDNMGVVYTLRCGENIIYTEDVTPLATKHDRSMIVTSIADSLCSSVIVFTRL